MNECDCEGGSPGTRWDTGPDGEHIVHCVNCYVLLDVCDHGRWVTDDEFEAYKREHPELVDMSA